MMTLEPLLRTLPLPKGWPLHVRSAVLHAISLASVALTLTRSRKASVRSSERRLLADLEHAQTEIAQLCEELDLKDARWRRLQSRRRPHYTAIERMRILELKAVRGWSSDQVSERFLIADQTMQSWMRRVDEGGKKALLQLDAPINRFPVTPNRVYFSTIWRSARSRAASSPS